MRSIQLAVKLLFVPIVVGFVSLIPSSAMAASWEVSYGAVVGKENYTFKLGGTIRGVGSANSIDKRLAMTDREADGYGMKVTWWAGGRSGTCVNEAGNGETRYCYPNANGLTVTYQFCMKNGSTVVACHQTDAIQF